MHDTKQHVPQPPVQFPAEFLNSIARQCNILPEALVFLDQRNAFYRAVGNSGGPRDEEVGI